MVRRDGNMYSAPSSTGWSAPGATASCKAEPARIAAAPQRAGVIAMRHAARRLPWRKPYSPPLKASAPPKAQTMAAPVGKSNANEAASPTALVSVPTAQPIANWIASERAKMAPIAAGTVRNEKNSKTPAIATEVVITQPNVATKKNSQPSDPDPVSW